MGQMRKPVYVYPFSAMWSISLQDGEYVQNIETDDPYLSFDKKQKVKIESPDGTNIWDPPSPERQWWMVLKDPWEEKFKESLTQTAGVRDLLTALNLCIDQRVLFSNYHIRQFRQFINSRNRLISITPNDYSGLASPTTPQKVIVERDVMNIYSLIDNLRYSMLQQDNNEQEFDLYMALALYNTAHQPQIRPESCVANLFFACENVLGKGTGSATETRDELSQTSSRITSEQAHTWYKYVKRVKHPDKGVKKLADVFSNSELPSISKMKAVTNRVLIGGLETNN